jgi:hypothetical protein
VPQFRKFIASHRTQVKATTDREALLIRKLQLQCEREAYALGEEREQTRKEILSKLMAQFTAVMHLVRTEIYRMRIELSPKFTGLDAREIYRAWEDREREGFKNVCAKLCKEIGASAVSEPDTRPVQNVIEFGHQRKAATNA